MRYYNLNTFNYMVYSFLEKNNAKKAFNFLTTKPHNVTKIKADLKISYKHIYMSEKDLLNRFMFFVDKTKKLGLELDFNDIDISSCLLDNNKQDDRLLVDFKGRMEPDKFSKFIEKARQKIKINPNYFYFRDLSEMTLNPDKVLSLDFEFSPTQGITQAGFTCAGSNGRLNTVTYDIKGKHRTSNSNVSMGKHEAISTVELKQKLINYFDQYETFIFHDYRAEKVLLEELFGGLEDTPFDGHKKIIDTRRAYDYMRERDLEIDNNGIEASLTGLCRFVGLTVDDKNFHNAGNDSLYTFQVASLLSEKWQPKWEQYVKRDEIKGEKKLIRPRFKPN